MHIVEIFDQTLYAPWETTAKGLDFCLLQHKPCAFWLIFQYTTTQQDWLYNFKFWTIPYKNMPRTWYAHKGFVELYKSGRDFIKPYMSHITRVSGFSQGAALAQLAIEDIYFHTGNSVQGFCFGCPKPFVIPPHKELRNYFSKAFDYTNIYNTRGDIVAKVPPFPYQAYGTKHILQIGSHLPNPLSHYPDMYRKILNKESVYV